MIPVIAKASGMNEDAARRTMSGFTFPSIEEQLSKKWLGGKTQKFLKEVADFFVAQGTIPEARKSYKSAVDTSYLKAASRL
jgi:taurine transport system substrate-binding protein